MTQKRNVRIHLLTAFVLSAAGGLLLHLGPHPLEDDAFNWFPAGAGLVAVFVLPPLFWFRRTAAWAYVINGMLVILGTILMVAYSAMTYQTWPGWISLVLNSTLPVIILLWSRMLIGKSLFELTLLRDDQGEHRRGRFWRYPNWGWWWVHLAGWSGVFVLGMWLWP